MPVAGQRDVILPVHQQRAVLARIVAEHAGDDEGMPLVGDRHLDRVARSEAVPPMPAHAIDDGRAQVGEEDRQRAEVL